ncbi:MAG TPA: poly(R)-hydroxyalkanoic acid synthase subunit PhaE [Steroidobacteraceae bacterium]|nr:poly(R)-hydroxyalkanoic acid synthase subunit PhaE [Steroidobacteraceae bacterium]
MTDPVQLWLAAQRELVERWMAAPEASVLQSEVQRWWQAIAQNASPDAQALSHQLAQLGPAFLAGAGDALFEIFGINVGASNVGAASGDAAPQAMHAPFARWLDVAPIGYFREHQQHAQDLARALDEYRRIAERMAGAIGHVHADALERLAKKINQLGADEVVRDTRRLYALWIESGEQAFAEHARADAFGRLQAELVNAGLHVRVAQQAIAEYFLKSLDLPTRAELNSVHKRLKDMRDRIEELEAEVVSRTGAKR